MALTAAEKPAKIPVFVRSAASVDGFTDPSRDRLDSLKDLQKRLNDSDWVRPVADEADAVAVLEVLARETKRESNGWTALSGKRQNRSLLTVRLTAGDYSTEFTGESGSKGELTGYRGAATSVVKQLEAWAKVNRDRLTGAK